MILSKELTEMIQFPDDDDDGDFMTGINYGVAFISLFGMLLIVGVLLDYFSVKLTG